MEEREREDDLKSLSEFFSGYCYGLVIFEPIRRVSCTYPYLPFDLLTHFHALCYHVLHYARLMISHNYVFPFVFFLFLVSRYISPLFCIIVVLLCDLKLCEFTLSAEPAYLNV